jgi:hypothetical protein
VHSNAPTIPGRHRVGTPVIFADGRWRGEVKWSALGGIDQARWQRRRVIVWRVILCRAAQFYAMWGGMSTKESTCILRVMHAHGVIMHECGGNA